MFSEHFTFLNFGIWISYSKFIMMASLLNNKRGKTNLRCGKNYIYSSQNKTGRLSVLDMSWIQKDELFCMTKTFIDGNETLNIHEHRHSSDITKINFLLAECDALKKTIENPALLPWVILAELSWSTCSIQCLLIEQTLNRASRPRQS